jgi:hypothetical protein
MYICFCEDVRHCFILTTAIFYVETHAHKQQAQGSVQTLA